MLSFESVVNDSITKDMEYKNETTICFHHASGSSLPFLLILLANSHSGDSAR
jgi:hypothetical protein